MARNEKFLYFLFNFALIATNWASTVAGTLDWTITSTHSFGLPVFSLSCNHLSSLALVAEVAEVAVPNKVPSMLVCASATGTEHRLIAMNHVFDIAINRLIFVIPPSPITIRARPYLSAEYSFTFGERTEK